MAGEQQSATRAAREYFAGNADVEVVSERAGWICLRVMPEMGMKQHVADFFRSQWSDLPGDLCEKLALALEELLGNSIEHGCKLATRCALELNHVRGNRMLLFHIRDAGPGFSLNSVPHAAVNNPPEDPIKHAAYRSQMGMRPGGFGIMLVKQIADELIYNELGNEVMLVKYLPPGY